MLEKVIEKTVCDYARSFGMFAYKFNSPARAAVPDRMFMYRGIVFFIEFKAHGKKPTPPQNREHARIREHDLSVFVVDNIQTGKHIIDMIALGILPAEIHKSLSEDCYQ